MGVVVVCLRALVDLLTEGSLVRLEGLVAEGSFVILGDLGGLVALVRLVSPGALVGLRALVCFLVESLDAAAAHVP